MLRQGGGGSDFYSKTVGLLIRGALQKSLIWTHRDHAATDL